MKKTICLFILISIFFIGCGKPESDVSTSSESVEKAGDLDFDEIVKVEPDETVNIFGNSLSFSIPNPDESGGGDVVVSYSDDESQLSLDYAEWLGEGYVVPEDDGFYFLIQKCFSNDWRSTAVVKYTKDEGIVLVGEVGGGIASSADIFSDSFVANSRTDIFGTYGYKQKYNYDTLLPESDYKEFIINSDKSFLEDEYDEETLDYLRQIYDDDGRQILILKSELEVYDEKGNSIIISPGHNIKPVGVNDKLQIFYLEYDGQEYSFSYTFDEDGFTKYIDGLSEDEMFVNLPYAG